MFKDIFLILKLFSIQFKAGNYDTAFLASFIRHFNKNSLDQTMRVWAVTHTGKRYLEGDSIVTDVLQYRNTQNTLASEYFEFIDKYYYGKLSDLVPTRNEDPKLDEAFRKFISDIHDFTHVLSGYPPDPVGELLRIEYGKDFEGNGWKVLSRVGKMRIFFNGIKEWYSCRPLYKAARQMGKMSKNYIFADWFNILGEDINKVRENLNTHPTTKYHWKIA